MKRYWRSLCLFLISLFIVVGCNRMPTVEQPLSTTPAATSPTATTEEACPTAYDPEQDYFLDKTSLDYATGFSVQYRNHYKVVTVTDPWQDANQSFQYVLVQCGTPAPTGFSEAQVIEVPIKSVVALSTTHLPHLVMLNQLERLIGVSQFDPINTPEVREKIESSDLQAFSSGNALDLERLLVAAPELVMTFASGNADTDSHGRLIAAGIPVAIVSEYREESPLGRAEWLKFTALFFNQEALAQERFEKISAAYNTMKNLAAAVSTRPTVFSGFSYEGTWYMPGGKSYVAQLLADAGAEYLWADVDSDGSLPLDFEAVFERAKAADFWVNMSQEWQEKGDAIAADLRYEKLAALQQNKAYNNNATVNATGGNDYWESGLVNPDIVLADLIKIFHPELLPDHELVYYQPLKP